MSLYKELLIDILSKEKLSIEFKNENFNLEKALQDKSYCLTEKMKSVLENDSLSDFECIEAIVCLFEENGVTIDYRHDFG